MNESDVINEQEVPSYRYIQGVVSVAVLAVFIVGFIFGLIVGKAEQKHTDTPVETTASTIAIEPETVNTESTIVTEAPEVTESPTEAPQETEPVIPEAPVAPPQLAYYDIPLSKDLQSHIFQICESRNIDPDIVIAMIYRESTYRDWLIGDGGDSFGLMQIQPKWHKPRMDKLGCTDLLDPYQNVTVGIDYLADLLEQGGSIEWALMAYNGGPDYANKKAAQGVITEYAKSVLQKAEELENVKQYV